MATKKYRNMLIDEMTARGLRKKTQEVYVKSMQALCNLHKKTADQIELSDIKAYLKYLIIDRKLAPNTVNARLSAVRFFYRVVMHRHGYDEALPRMKAPQTLPQVLSTEEVAKMIKSVDSPFYKAVLMLTYSSGLRNSEVRNLKITDIDSKRMVIHVRDGKGGIDRQAMLSPVALEYLRIYWRVYRLRLNKHVKSDWLFIPTKNSFNGELNKRLSHTTLGYIVSKAASLAGIKKKFTPICCDTRLQLTF